MNININNGASIQGNIISDWKQFDAKECEGAYDSDQNISHLLTVTTEGEKLQDFTYQYDLNGNRTSKVGLNQATHFAYDSMNRLIKAQYPKREESFTPSNFSLYS